jgi:N-acetylmuramoyl-L-alanine amidase
MRCLVFLLYLFFSCVSAQQALVVNGQSVTGLSTTLIEGSSYIPAASLADAVGAQFGYDATARVVTFDYSSRFISITVYNSPQEAAADSQALSVDGQSYPSTGAVNVSGTVYVPVKPIIAALSGSLYFSEELQKIIVTFPRAVLRPPVVQSLADYDRLIFDFEGRTPYQLFINPSLNTLQIRFEHLEPVAAQAFATGIRFTQAVLNYSGGIADLVIQLQPNIMFETYTTATPSGFNLVVDLFQAEATSQALSVVVDAGHGGQDTGLVQDSTTEADIALTVSQVLEGLLNQNGVQSTLTRDSNLMLSIDERAEQGIGANLFLSLHTANLSPGQINIYYLNEVSDAANLNIAIARNAQQALGAETTDTLRRRLLLRFVPDVTIGERYAQAIANSLRQNPGFTVGHLSGLPLKVLEGAAGRGVLIEFSQSDLANPQLPGYLWSAIMAALAVQ